MLNQIEKKTKPSIRQSNWLYGNSFYKLLWISFGWWKSTQTFDRVLVSNFFLFRCNEMFVFLYHLRTFQIESEHYFNNDEEKGAFSIQLSNDRRARFELNFISFRFAFGWTSACDFVWIHFETDEWVLQIILICRHLGSCKAYTVKCVHPALAIRLKLLKKKIKFGSCLGKNWNCSSFFLSILHYYYYSNMHKNDFYVMLWVILIYGFSFTMRHSANSTLMRLFSMPFFFPFLLLLLSMCAMLVRFPFAIFLSRLYSIQLKTIIHLHIAITWINYNSYFIFRPFRKTIP